MEKWINHFVGSFRVFWLLINMTVRLNVEKKKILRTSNGLAFFIWLKNWEIHCISSSIAFWKITWSFDFSIRRSKIEKSAGFSDLEFRTFWLLYKHVHKWYFPSFLYFKSFQTGNNASLKWSPTTDYDVICETTITSWLLTSRGGSSVSNSWGTKANDRSGFNCESYQDIWPEPTDHERSIASGRLINTRVSILGRFVTQTVLSYHAISVLF